MYELSISLDSPGDRRSESLGGVWQAGSRGEPHAKQEAEHCGGGDAESGWTPALTHHQAEQGTDTDKVMRPTYIREYFSTYQLRMWGATVRG